MSFIKEIFRAVLYIPFYNLLIFFAWATGGSVGWSIVILTIIIRLILLPSSLKAAKASVKLQAVQPKMNEIRTKHKDDPKKMNEEMMRLYKEEGTSPWGSCLPLLIQLPIIIILYQVFQIGLDTSRYDLLYSFTPRPEALHTVFLGFNLALHDLWILPIIAGATQMLLSWMTLPKASPTQKNDPMAMMNKQMIFLFPLITIFIARSVPAALVIYWIITTIFSIGQQYYVNTNIRNEKLKTKNENSAELSPVQIDEPKENKAEKPAKKDLMTKVMQGRLDKQDKKKGVSITIREKK
ncbi:MAG: YidC/Oxa1 family membrane protein insertase [Patescibacteria group bacterium]